MDCDKEKDASSLARSDYKRSDSRLAVDRAIRLSRQKMGWNRVIPVTIGGAEEGPAKRSSEEPGDD